MQLLGGTVTVFDTTAADATANLLRHIHNASAAKRVILSFESSKPEATGGRRATNLHKL